MKAGTASEVPAVVHEVLNEAGQPLDSATRALMEPRFGHDFSRVRVHTSPKAARSAESVDAVAYTVGSDIAFGSRQFNPDSGAGRRLIAHELTHVVQQAGRRREGQLSIAPAASDLERQATEAEGSPISAERTSVSAAHGLVQRAPREGTSVLDDSAVTLNPADAKAPGVVSGTVTRKEYGDKHALIHQMDARVRFDPANCNVTVPVRIAYREPTADDFASFVRVNPGIKPKAAPKGVGRKVFDRYLSVTNDHLNGWVAIQFGECKGSPCSGRIVPVRVDVSEDNASPDYTVSVVDGGDQGRSAVFPSTNTVVLAGDGGDVSSGTLAHEGGHMALGAGDEYEETELKGRDPTRIRRDDFSLMADHNDYGGWALLHERHFQFVPSFLTAALKSIGKPCAVQLEGLARPAKFDFEVDFAFSGGRLTGSPMFGMGGGVSAGVLSGSRNWRGFIEAHATYLMGLDYPMRTAFLLGARLGVDRRFTPSSGGLFLGGYAEAGKGYFGGPDTSKPGTTAKTSFTSPYGEAGVRGGYGVSPMGGVILKVFADAAAGTTLNVNDPNHQYWFRAGLGAGFEF